MIRVYYFIILKNGSYPFFFSIDLRANLGSKILNSKIIYFDFKLLFRMMTKKLLMFNLKRNRILRLKFH